MATTSTNLSSGKHRTDSEIEKYRLELNWTKILDKLKTAKASEYVKFLDGEAQLEYYLQQYPLTDNRHIEKSREELIRVENLLKSVLSSRLFEVECLLAKLYYAQARYDECLLNVNLAINSIPNDINDQPNRSSLLLAEIYALKGLLLEKKNEDLFEIIKSFDDSCKLSQTYYAAVEKDKHLSNENLDIENSLIELAYQRLPLLHASNNNLTTAIEIFRSFIQNVHIKSLETMRQTLIKQYAELLIKCVCKGNYPRLTNIDNDLQNSSLLNRRRSSQSLFIPRDVNEEILLLLLLGQTSTLNEAVLDWQPEHEGQRERSHQAAYNILALLSIFLSRKQAFHLIADSYEQALRFSFEHFQTWFNYGLSLISSGQSFRAYLILKECLRMQPKNIQVYLQLAKIILEHIYDFRSLFETFPSSGEDAQPLLKQTLNQQQTNLTQHEQRPRFIDLIDEAIDYCQQAKELENPPFARSLVLLAVAKSFKARQTSIHNDRQALFQSAVNDLRESIQLDPYDSIAHFHLAHNLSFHNQTDEALKSIETCLLLSPDDKFALHLHTLLLTAQKQMAEAYAQIYRATNDYPDISLLLTKATIEEELYGCEQSIATCKEGLLLWKNEFEPFLTNNDHGLSHSSGGNRPDSRSKNPSINTETDAEQTLNNQQGTLKIEDGIKNLFLFGIRPFSVLINDENSMKNNRSSTSLFSVQPIYFSLIQIFEYLVRYYIKLDKIDEGERCIKEISSLSPLCHQMFYMRGLINDARGQLKLAKQNYNDALAINPYHFPTLIQLTKLLIQIGNYSLAEKYARDAISIQPSNYQPWYLLSLSMEARGEYEQSIEVGATAVHLEGNSPIVSYHSIMRVL
ncbi:unnamed protein product [Rotaria socialis]|uniref:Tetratricopeptide repeat protein 7 N-terminal domain-containing protein n=1 Tax=Rotaria socialis TaxID=392032 RepID=A0A820Q672_9BILA|nr:unnamed protein product [Rotaria socialis]CAF3184889.1 unnamed protein product [Rotaria socialis]CAF3315710.1 unnamed protein product [Rotaria socialis]CAF3787026.1 unnamed protein product [Rotaria socialis]CAF4389716.1 unnamed protein product [Rotaria socialis]